MSYTYQQANTSHFLSHASYHNKFDHSITPALTIASGDTVVFDCEEATGGQITSVNNHTNDVFHKLFFLSSNLTL